MNKMNKFKKYSMIPMIAAAVLLTGCEKDDVVPEEEHDHEEFTDVKLIFTPTEGAVVTALAKDPPGAEELEVLDSINLKKNTDYKLTFEILNLHEDDDDDDDDHDDDDHDDHDPNVTAEIEEEDFEHQFFFAFDNNVFDSPTGNGNIDNASDPIDYLDTDSLGRHVGLETSWKTSSVSKSNKLFRVVLMHQPGVKTDNSSVNDGDADFDLTFVLNIE